MCLLLQFVSFSDMKGSLKLHDEESGAKDEEIERKMEIGQRLGCLEEETKRIALIREVPKKRRLSSQIQVEEKIDEIRLWWNILRN
ncbi:hypothetical protein YC2023_044388 [Brassica napus]